MNLIKLGNIDVKNVKRKLIFKLCEEWMLRGWFSLWLRMRERFWFGIFGDCGIWMLAYFRTKFFVLLQGLWTFSLFKINVTVLSEYERINRLKATEISKNFFYWSPKRPRNCWVLSGRKFIIDLKKWTWKLKIKGLSLPAKLCVPL